MTSLEVAVRAPTSTVAQGKKGAKAKQYSIVVQGGITHESGATDVKEALIEHYGFTDTDAHDLSTQFVNGISARRGIELMEAVATFGREMVLWLIKGLSYALMDPSDRASFHHCPSLQFREASYRSCHATCARSVHTSI
jgi:hypothetical protein